MINIFKSATKLFLLLILFQNCTSNSQRNNSGNYTTNGFANQVDSKSDKNIEGKALVNSVIHLIGSDFTNGSSRSGAIKGEAVMKIIASNSKIKVIVKYRYIMNSGIKQAQEEGYLENFSITDGGPNNTKIIRAEWNNLDAYAPDGYFTLSSYEDEPKTIIVQIDSKSGGNWYHSAWLDLSDEAYKKFLKMMVNDNGSLPKISSFQNEEMHKDYSSTTNHLVVKSSGNQIIAYMQRIDQAFDKPPYIFMKDFVLMGSRNENEYTGVVYVCKDVLDKNYGNFKMTIQKDEVILYLSMLTSLSSEPEKLVLPLTQTKYKLFNGSGVFEKQSLSSRNILSPTDEDFEIVDIGKYETINEKTSVWLKVKHKNIMGWNFAGLMIPGIETP
jgi:hypothetical protein